MKKQVKIIVEVEIEADNKKTMEYASTRVVQETEDMMCHLWLTSVGKNGNYSFTGKKVTLQEDQ